METYYEAPHKKHHHWKLILVVCFLLVLLVIAYPLIFDWGMPFTGSAIGVDGQIEGINIIGDLTVPAMLIKGGASEIIIEGRSDADFIVGGEKFNLNSATGTFITLKQFEGKLNFDPSAILLLKGRADEVLINGVSVESEANRSMKIRFDDEFNYKFLLVKDVAIGEISYPASGEIIANDQKTVLSLEEENLLIKSFIGELRVENGRLKLNGNVKRLSVEGDIGVSVG